MPYLDYHFLELLSFFSDFIMVQCPIYGCLVGQNFPRSTFGFGGIGNQNVWEFKINFLPTPIIIFVQFRNNKSYPSDLFWCSLCSLYKKALAHTPEKYAITTTITIWELPFYYNYQTTNIEMLLCVKNELNSLCVTSDMSWNTKKVVSTLFVWFNCYYLYITWCDNLGMGWLSL